MKTSELDYFLPPELIAQEGLADRASSRLMVVDRGAPVGQAAHRHFYDLGEYLDSNDCLVINQTRVIPARFFARRVSGGRIEGLFLQLAEEGRWEVLLKNASRVRVGEELLLVDPHSWELPEEPVALKVIERIGEGLWHVEPAAEAGHLAILGEYGVPPLPPYIQRQGKGGPSESDRQRYQTVFAEVPGSVAAPTAGLHFTQELLGQIQARGVRVAKIILHVGLGTFKPISTEIVEGHPMHAEWYELDESNAELIQRTRETNGRIIAVGTTSVRTLETVAGDGTITAGSGWTDIFITPGYGFRVVNAIITNFHLPRSTLLALVCAFGGTERILEAYRRAIKAKYRFYSYGDAMLLL